MTDLDSKPQHVGAGEQSVRFIDLRSDTVTRPTAGMRHAMAEAEVGDDVYGEDPSVNELEGRVAAMLGHEAGLFTPTGSLANQLGIRLLVEPGAELLCDTYAHVVRAELGAAAAIAGVTTRTWLGQRGLIDLEAIAAMMAPDAGPHLVSTTAVAVENTHNFGGGTVQPVAELRRLRDLCADVGIALHLDGARLWNAHVASGVALETYGELFDTVSVCLSKGLGAPVGSVLVASAERIARARVWRKRLGAGMRQVGILAAAGTYALDHHLLRLAEDHERARRLAKAIAAADATVVDADAVETNIIPLDLTHTAFDAVALASEAKKRGVLISVLGPRRARLLTHLDVDDDAVDEATQVLTGLLGSGAA